MFIKKYLACLMIAGFIFSSTSCGVKTDELEEKLNPYEFDYIEDQGPQNSLDLKLFSVYLDNENPILSKNTYYNDFGRLIYDRLIEIDKNNNITGGLIKEWKFAEDGLSIILYLRENVKWHDGKMFTAEDVIFTFETILNKENNSVYITNLNNLIKYNMNNQTEIELILKEKDFDFLWGLHFPIIAKHSINEEDNSFKKDKLFIGTGMYKFVNMKNREYIELMNNEFYWKIEQNLIKEPHISNIKIQLYESTNDIFSAFQTNSVDAISLDNGMWGRFIGRRDITLKSYPNLELDYLVLNQNSSFLWDEKVREAISLLIDKNDTIKYVLPREATITDFGLFPNSYLNQDINYEIIDNEAKVNKLLEEADFKINDQGVIYKYIYGKYRELSLRIIVNQENQIRIKIADKLKEQLSKYGIKLEIKKLSEEKILYYIKNNYYDIAFLGAKMTSKPDLEYLFKEGDLNPFKYTNEEITKKFEDLKLESTNSKKKEILGEIRNILLDEKIFIFMYYYNDSMVYNKKVRGYRSPHYWNKYAEINNWYIIDEDGFKNE